MDHVVLATGYKTTADGRRFWRVKNSWSAHWGDGGYIWIAEEGNVCGVANTPTYPVLRD